MAYEVWGQESETVVYCAFCPKWKIEGPAREVQELARAHRAEFHPDLPPPTRRRKANLGNWRTTITVAEGEELAEERAKRLRLLGIKVET